MKYYVEVWNETYGYWDWGVEFKAANDVMNFMSSFGKGWKLRWRKINV